MAKSGKGLSREMRRKLKRQQKEYARMERKSVKRQKRELKMKNRNRRRKLFREQGGWFRFIINQFFGSEKSKPVKFRQKRKKSPFPPIEKKREPIPQDTVERKKIRAKEEKRKSEFVKQEKESLKKEARRLKQHKRFMRRKLRQERNHYLRKQLVDFFRSPFTSKKRTKHQAMLQQQIREDIKRERQQYFKDLPGKFSGNISRKISHRRRRWRSSVKQFRKSMGKFGEFMDSPELRNDVFKTSVNSTVLFIIAFLMMYFTNRLVTIFTAGFFDIPAVLYSYRIFWPLYTYSTLYSRIALVVIFATGPLISIIIAIGFYRIFLWAKKYSYNAKTLLVWIIFHGINLFFGAYIAGVITRTGFVYTTEWIFFSSIFDVEEIIFLIVSVIVLVIAGFLLTRHFITSATTMRMINPKMRLYYMIGQVLFPWIVGTIALWLMNYPQNPPELLLLYAVSILMIIPTLATYNSPTNQLIKLKTIRRKVRIGWIYLVLLLALLFFIRTILFKGISFS